MSIADGFGFNFNILQFPAKISGDFMVVLISLKIWNPLFYQKTA